MTLPHLSFWGFVDERLAIANRKKRGRWPLTQDPILQCGVFANIFGEDDPDTQRAHDLSRGLSSLRQQVHFDILFRYSGSHVQAAAECVAAGPCNTWTRILRNRSDRGESIIRTDAYHNMWGKGLGRGLEFFTNGSCEALAEHA